jgi:hypothetical protein
MKATLHNKLLDSLQKASQHNSQIMVRPEVILWPDPERQWEAVIQIPRRVWSFDQMQFS